MNTLSAPFLNRSEDFDPSDWFHLVPSGEFPVSRRENGVRVRYQQVVDAAALDAIVADFNRKRSENPAYRMLIDFDHFSHQADKPSDAACWVTDMEVRPNGVWAKGEWSDEGAAAIKNKRYRFLSPVWFPAQTQALGSNRFRPVAVNDAGLTNKPNMGDALQPFWNRAEDDFTTAAAQPPAAANNNPDTTMDDKLKTELIALLALGADATDEQIIAAVKALQTSSADAAAKAAEASQATAQAEAIQNRLVTLETAHKALLSSRVDEELKRHADLIPEADLPAWKNRLESDFDGTSGLLARLKRPDAYQPMHRAGSAAAAAASQSRGDQPFLNRVSEFQKADTTLSHNDAIIRAAREHPDEYDQYVAGLTTRA
jgi:phage I-like protein